jgi:hypothetical protein
MSLRARWLSLALMLIAPSAHADRPAGVCIDVSATFVPTDELQIVAWVEDRQGNFIDTIYVTSKIGRYGLGNRPGRFDFNSGSPLHDSWPYGRRITTFPVWAHRHGKTFPMIVSQNGDDSQLSHPFDQSSPEDTPPFCMPMLPDNPSFDAITCASVSYSDKGVFSPDATSLYPPRADITRQSSVDSESVDMYRALDAFDAISQATPIGGARAELHWAAPASVDLGDYVLWMEVAKSYDMNASYDPSRFPSPTQIPYAEYGKPYRGQPSVVYEVPFQIDMVASSATTTDYVGYGDADGIDGMLRPPDATITTDTPGAGGSRLLLVSDSGAMYRVRVDMQPSLASDPPPAPTSLAASVIGASTATMTFAEPAGPTRIVGYDVRIRAGSPITAENFDTSTPVTARVTPLGAGTPQTIQLDGLLPETTYWIGVRGYDSCSDQGALAIASLTTTDVKSGAVDACFIATAAYGSLLANDVQLLRRFRDTALRSNVLGELAVETYYTFGPAPAGVIANSELLRMSARDALAPLIAAVKRSQ